MYSIGIPREIKEYERRVSLVPSDIKRLLDTDITVYIQANAGYEAGYSDEDYAASGATIVDTIEEVYENADIIVKVKEPQPRAYALITSRHTILSFFHFAGNSRLIEAMLESRAKCYAYETIQDSKGQFPILSPMSIIAGK